MITRPVTRSAGPIALALLLSVLSGALLYESRAAFAAERAQRRELRLPIPDFSLTDQSGAPFHFRSLRGKVVLVSFIYTTCPDVCPLLTTRVRLVQKGLDDRERHSVFFLSVTTDPEVDTPEVLRSYAGRYGADLSNWSFLTKDLKSLEPVWAAFGVRVVRRARGLVNHTPLTALVDQQGTLRFGHYGGSTDHQVVLNDLRPLLSSH